MCCHRRLISYLLKCPAVTLMMVLLVQLREGGGRPRLMLDDCSKTRCHNGQPCLAHLQCSTSFVLSPKYYPAMNYSGGTKLFQTWKGFDQNCSMGKRQIFSTLTTLTHSTGPCQLNNDNCEYVNILDDMILVKTVFF